MGINCYKELVIWQKSMDIAVNVHELTKGFPDDEKFGMTSQIRRSCYSIPSNIAEGFGRKNRKEFTRFLRIAIGSAFELQTQIELSKRIGYIDQEIAANISLNLDEIGKMTNSLISKMEDNKTF